MAKIDAENPLPVAEDVNRLGAKVKNISSSNLTEGQLHLLELGSTFCPVEHNRARLQKDLNDGFRRMKHMDQFKTDEDSRTEEEIRFYIKKSDYELAQNVSKDLIVHNYVIQRRFYT